MTAVERCWHKECFCCLV
ncbi:hypothetical protein [Gynurincola endophyticus]